MQTMRHDATQHNDYMAAELGMYWEYLGVAHVMSPDFLMPGPAAVDPGERPMEIETRSFHIYIYIYVCMYVCIERERERE